MDNSTDSSGGCGCRVQPSLAQRSEVGLLAVVDTVLAITPDPSEPLAMKWIEIADEKNWDQLRQIFEPSAEKLCQAGLHTKVLIRRGNPADQILEEANTWGANCIFVGAKGDERHRSFATARATAQLKS